MNTSPNHDPVTDRTDPPAKKGRAMMIQRLRSAGGVRGLFVPRKKIKPGDRPGVDHLPAESLANDVDIECIDYDSKNIDVRTFDDLQPLNAQPRPDGAAVRWINLNGLNLSMLHTLKEVYGLHTLAIEDVISIPQRPKIERYGEHLFIVVRMFRRYNGNIISEQVSMFLFAGLVITIQERPGDVWQPIRQRLQTESSRLRREGADFLVYALLDAIIDHCFSLLSIFGEHLDAIEERVLANPTPQVQSEIYAIKRELGGIRRVIWPMRDAIHALFTDDQPPITASVHPFLRDVEDHTVRVLEGLEAYREMATSLTEMYATVVSNRMNEVMKILTIIATIFIPITFLAGVYGMNFEHIPEMHWRWAYPGFWAICLAMTAGLVWYFRRKRWL